MVIRGQAMLSLTSFFPPAPLRRNLEGILKAAERATALTRQLLAFSRKQVLQPKILDLNSLVAQVAELLPPLLGEDIRLQMALDQDLGRVLADPGQVEQVLMNLVVNARDAMPDGGELTIETSNVDLEETSAVHYSGFHPGPHVMMAIKDTGYGMDADTRSHAFEPFFTTQEKTKGTGLGLATAYGIIEQSGGGISLLSEPGRGTTVTIYFPRTDEPAEEVEQPQGRCMRTLERLGNHSGGGRRRCRTKDDADVFDNAWIQSSRSQKRGRSNANRQAGLQVDRPAVNRRGHARNEGTRTGGANCRDLRRAGSSLYVRLHRRRRRE